MSKQEFIDKLINLGYHAEIIDGIPYLLDLTYSAADKIVKDIGYNSSYGVRRVND